MQLHRSKLRCKGYSQLPHDVTPRCDALLKGRRRKPFALLGSCKPPLQQLRCKWSVIDCYVGVSDKSIPETKGIILDSTSKWTRSAECNVMLEDGQIKDLRIHGECDCCNASAQD